MSLVVARPTTIAPPVPLAEMFRAALLSECRSTIERVCSEAMSAIEAACGAAPAAKPEVLKSKTIPTVTHEVRGSEASKGCHLSESHREAVNAAGKRRTLGYILPKMLAMDADFGGTLTADLVCSGHKIPRSNYHHIKKIALTIRRCHTFYGGEMNITQTARVARTRCETVSRYLKIMKEGFDA